MKVHQLMAGIDYEGATAIFTTMDENKANELCNAINHVTGIAYGRKNYKTDFTADDYFVMEVEIDNPAELEAIEASLRKCGY